MRNRAREQADPNRAREQADPNRAREQADRNRAREQADPNRAREQAGAIPCYELRAARHGAGDLELEIWQLPSPATPALAEAKRVAGLRGRNLDMVENRLLKQLRGDGIDPTGLRKKGDKKAWQLPEDGALRLGLLFRVLAPMRRRENIGACAAGIGEMGREEAAYWLGMAMHRKNPRRVLTALRVLLIDPKAS